MTDMCVARALRKSTKTRGLLAFLGALGEADQKCQGTDIRFLFEVLEPFKCVSVLEFDELYATWDRCSMGKGVSWHEKHDEVSEWEERFD